jgi:hypothetical protein
VNAKNEFSVYAEAEMKALVFKESDLVGYFAGKMKAADGFGDEYSFKTTKIAYEVPKVDFAAGKMSVPVDFEGIAELPLNLDSVRSMVVGKSMSELEGIIGAIPGVEKTTVKFWPFYVRRVPSDPSPDKLSIAVE